MSKNLENFLEMQFSDTCHGYCEDLCVHAQCNDLLCRLLCGKQSVSRTTYHLRYSVDKDNSIRLIVDVSGARRDAVTVTDS